MLTTPIIQKIRNQRSTWYNFYSYGWYSLRFIEGGKLGIFQKILGYQQLSAAAGTT